VDQEDLDIKPANVDYLMKELMPNEPPRNEHGAMEDSRILRQIVVVLEQRHGARVGFFETSAHWDRRTQVTANQARMESVAASKLQEFETDEKTIEMDHKIFPREHLEAKGIFREDLWQKQHMDMNR